jgi:PBP1b-binding outer membrane lipoprotein LpoB
MLKKTSIFLLLCLAAIFISGCSNPHTPAGIKDLFLKILVYSVKEASGGLERAWKLRRIVMA